jgi:hypothetical protein
MVFIGFFIHGNLQSWKIEEMRLSYSVLEMLGLGYVIVVVCVLYLSTRGQIIATGIFLVGYWALQMFVPVPGHDWGVFKEGGLFGDWLYDHSIGLLGKPWKSHWGRGFPFLPMWTHVATTMLGVFGTYILLGKSLGTSASPPADGSMKSAAAETPVLPDAGSAWAGPRLRRLVLLGLGCLLVAWLWSFHSADREEPLDEHFRPVVRGMELSPAGPVMVDH